MEVGIEAINVYGGSAHLDVKQLADHRLLDLKRFDNLLMKEKSVSLNFEDPVSFAVNAAKPLLDEMSEDEKNRIELLIVSSESGIDFGKPISAYVHHYLGLKKNCRNFETKHACYGGTASLQMAVNFIAAGVSPGAKALVISTDIARPIPDTYAEPSQGAAAVAMLVSSHPVIFELDLGANGYYGYEIMDTCRPTPDLETGDPDLSLMSYLDCVENSFKCYRDRVEGVDFQETFSNLAFHTPFAGMVKGAHRIMMRKLKRLSPGSIEEDFRNRVEPSFLYCQRVGNIYSGTVFLALCGVIDSVEFKAPRRIGLFSYGSGCCSEFFSGIADRASQDKLSAMKILDKLNTRHGLSMDEYETLLQLNKKLMFGIKDMVLDFDTHHHIYERHFQGKGLLVLKRIVEYHREYEWV